MRRGRKTSAEQVVLKLRQIEVQPAQGKSLSLACKEAEISKRSHYHWRKEYGGLQVDQARIKDPERENARLRRLRRLRLRLAADLLLKNQVLADVAAGNLLPLSEAGRRSTGSGRNTASRNVTPAGSSVTIVARSAT